MLIGAAASVASAGSSVAQALGGSSKAKAQAATPAAAATTPFETSTARNTSETEASILRREQARKAGGASGSESILTGGLGALGNPATQTGASTLLGL